MVAKLINKHDVIFHIQDKKVLSNIQQDQTTCYLGLSKTRHAKYTPQEHYPVFVYVCCVQH